MISFFFHELHSFTFNLRFLYELKHKVCLSKRVCEIFHFRFRFVLLKFLFLFNKMQTILKVHWCRFENLPLSSSSYENDMLKILHENIFYSLRYAHLRYVKRLFTNIQIQQNMIKNSLLFKKFTNFMGK